jgi:hypothetical protein
MLNFQDFKNGTTIGDKLIVLVDEVNENYSFGFTDSISKVLYNMKMLGNFLSKGNIEEQLTNSKDGLTTLFPLGRYIAILKMKKDKSAMSMMLFDFRAEYSIIDTNFKDVFSENVITQFKKLKYQMEDLYDDEADCVLIDSKLEPPLE